MTITTVQRTVQGCGDGETVISYVEGIDEGIGEDSGVQARPKRVRPRATDQRIMSQISNLNRK
jgi:hypothetical protein